LSSAVSKQNLVQQRFKTHSLQTHDKTTKTKLTECESPDSTRFCASTIADCPGQNECSNEYECPLLDGQSLFCCLNPSGVVESSVDTSLTEANPESGAQQALGEQVEPVAVADPNMPSPDDFWMDLTAGQVLYPQPTCGVRTDQPPKCLSADDPTCSKCIGEAWDGDCVAQWAIYIGRQWRTCGIKYSQDPDRLTSLCDPTKKLHSQHGDCSSFVTTVLKNAGYECMTKQLGGMISTLGYRENLIAKLGNQYHKEDPVAGDLIMWKYEKGTKKSGHIGIVWKVDTETGCVRIVNEGSGDKGPTGWDDCRSYAYPPVKGDGSFIPYPLGGTDGYQGFWTPTAKAE